MISDLIHRHGSHSGDFLQVLHQNGLQIRNVPAIFRLEGSRVVKRPSRLNSCSVWPSDWLSGGMWCNGFRRMDLFSIYLSGKKKTNLNLNWRFWVRQSNSFILVIVNFKWWNFIFKLRSKSSWDKINTYFPLVCRYLMLLLAKWNRNIRDSLNEQRKYFRHPLVKSVFLF